MDHVTSVILASSSPRRKELLEGLGLKFTIDTDALVNETIPRGLKPDKAAEKLALDKAQAVTSKYDHGIIIGADTIVALDDIILGKPVSNEDAMRMLMSLQGRTHCVYTGIAVINAATNKQYVTHVATEVDFRQIKEDEAQRYIETGEPKDKAGSYAIQGLGAIFISGIRGDYFNVVGLPLFKLAEILKRFGVNII